MSSLSVTVRCSLTISLSLGVPFSGSTTTGSAYAGGWAAVTAAAATSPEISEMTSRRVASRLLQMPLCTGVEGMGIGTKATAA